MFRLVDVWFYSSSHCSYDESENNLCTHLQDLKQPRRKALIRRDRGTTADVIYFCGQAKAFYKLEKLGHKYLSKLGKGLDNCENNLSATFPFVIQRQPLCFDPTPVVFSGPKHLFVNNIYWNIYAKVQPAKWGIHKSEECIKSQRLWSSWLNGHSSPSDHSWLRSIELTHSFLGCRLGGPCWSLTGEY